jgi:diguanylate cyclase (GGDEF)-like protein/PAS domain S-box-containing protein
MDRDLTDGDLTERMRLEEELRISREKLSAIIENAPIGIVLATPDAVILEANPAFSHLVAIPKEELPGMHISVFTHPEDLKADLDQVNALVRGEIPSFTMEKRYLRKGEEPLWVRIHVFRYPEMSGKLILLALVEDISLFKKTEDIIHQRSLHDVLTGLPNRMLLLDRINQAVSQARRSDELVAVLFLDLDRFKSINDSLGHAIGDRLLQQAADRLLASLQQYDSVSRSGGDEFIILLTGRKHLNQIRDITERIIKLMAEPFEVAGHELFTSTSIGVAVFPQDGEDADTLIRHADIALYKAKHLGRNCYAFYNPEENLYNKDRLRLENEMRRALRENQFLLHYQPQIHLATGSLAGFEALVRWNHPARGMVPPGLFIPIAEETGMILPLGTIVLREGFATAARWLESAREGFQLSVNISGHQFHQKDFLSEVIALRDQYRLPPYSIELEITESIAMQMKPATLDVLHALRQEKFLIALDDFGTGYSSLKYLQELPLDCLKIDRSFIEHLETDARRRGLLASIINMARILELSVVAEGVETEGQINILQDLGCDRVQGYYFSPPVSEHKAREFLARLT